MNRTKQLSPQMRVKSPYNASKMMFKDKKIRQDIFVDNMLLISKFA